MSEHLNDALPLYDVVEINSHEKNSENFEINDDLHSADTMQGRAAFLVQTIAAGISVSTVFVVNDGKSIAMPAIFPNLGYALSQIEQLKLAATQHFDEAAQVGIKIIAEKLANDISARSSDES